MFFLTGLLSGLGNLKILWMDYNDGMTNIRQNAFMGLHRLEQLWLQGNRIITLWVGLFRGLHNLEELSLDNNQLIELQPGLFDGLESLTKIWLYNNKLTTLPSDLFPNLPRPLEFTIGANPLTCDRSLCWLKRLEHQRHLSWITLAGRQWYPQCAHGSTWNNVSLACPNEGKKAGKIHTNKRDSKKSWFNKCVLHFTVYFMVRDLVLQPKVDFLCTYMFIYFFTQVACQLIEVSVSSKF